MCESDVPCIECAASAQQIITLRGVKDLQECIAWCRWWWYFIWAFLQPILCGWIAIAPPVVGNWCAGGFTMIDQFKDHNGAPLLFLLLLAHMPYLLSSITAQAAFPNGPLTCDTINCKHAIAVYSVSQCSWCVLVIDSCCLIRFQCLATDV